MLMPGIGKETQCCLNCKHFYQHYVEDERWQKGFAVPIYMGHCVYPRKKYRRCEDACEHFQKRE